MIKTLNDDVKRLQSTVDSTLEMPFVLCCIVIKEYFVVQTTAADILHLTRETVLIDDRQSACVLCCFPHQLLVVAETDKSQWTVKWSWKAKQV